MVAVISFDVYHFLVFSDLICHLEATGTVFSGCTVPPDSNEINLEVATKRLLCQQVKISG